MPPVPADYDSLVDYMRRLNPAVPDGIPPIAVLAFGLVSPRGALLYKSTENGLVDKAGNSIQANMVDLTVFNLMADFTINGITCTAGQYTYIGMVDISNLKVVHPAAFFQVAYSYGGVNQFMDILNVPNGIAALPFNYPQRSAQTVTLQSSN